MVIRHSPCNKIPPEVTCRVTCGVRIQRLGPDLGLAKGRVNLEVTRIGLGEPLENRFRWLTMMRALAPLIIDPFR